MPAAASAVVPPPVPAPLHWEDGQIVVRVPGAAAVFTTRSGGDLAGAGPEPGLRRLVPHDPAQWVQADQVHGAAVHTVDVPAPMRGEYDAQVTARSDLAVAVRVADCVPIALLAPEAVGVVHGGWRGLVGGVVPSAVDAMRAAGATSIVAVIGPCARVCCYETGPEVHEALAATGTDARRGTHADLPAVARHQLRAAGAGEIHDAGLCTLCAPAGLLFSHRRDGGATGRQGVVAWRS